ncbi:GNAT family N-acetyltransferase [Actinomadura rubrisoli]|uniref:GNAT family N-acetyltransferase n=1 Tax=Actinomadura rubrisoli TaxID=2530368 RepID=A0A4R5B915_9ACTN|nr:GNAT family N-acetyltransferase [Actinomadura rubrisoli]TDD81519.1 GNAT family N-acetyltransferase [Actinomadura rubrisoli]
MTEGFTVRHPTLDDVPAILAVVEASDIATVGEPDFTADEVREVLTAPGHDPSKDSWIAARPDGGVIAWGFIESTTGDHALIDVYAHPDGGRPAQAPLLRLALARMAERVRESGLAEITVRTGAIASEEHWIGLLKASGFAFVKRYARMSRPLSGLERFPDLPDGIALRPVRPGDESDLRTVHTVLRAAFADIPDAIRSGFEEFKATVEALPGVSWDEWFVAEADGRAVGALQSADQGAQDGEGWVKHLGVLREHRGKGIGRLMLLTAFATYAAKGRSRAGLGVDLTNPTSAYRLYESVGLYPVYEADVYERKLAAGFSPT